MVEDSVYAASQLEQMLYKGYLEKDPYTSVYILRINAQICHLLQTDCDKNLEDSDCWFEGDSLVEKLFW